MIVIYLLLCFLIACPPLVLVLIWPGHADPSMREPFSGRNFAHRGLHSKEKNVPENSLPAFLAAANAGYGIELDIQFSKDGQIVVFHDDTLDRVCGVRGRVDEYTFDELTHMPLCGTQERIPLFTEVLSAVDGRVPLIVELKNGSKNTLLCEQACALLRAYHGDYCVESFNPFIVGWFRKHAPEILRGQLSAPAQEFEGQVPGYQAFLLSQVLSNVVARPHFIAYEKKTLPFLVWLSEALGAMRVVWTVRDNDPVEKIARRNDAVIFEFYHPPVRNR